MFSVSCQVKCLLLQHFVLTRTQGAVHDSILFTIFIDVELYVVSPNQNKSKTNKVLLNIQILKKKKKKMSTLVIVVVVVVVVNLMILKQMI